MKAHCVVRDSEEHATCIFRLVLYGPLWDELQVSKPQKCAKLGRTCVALTSQAGPESTKTNVSATTTPPVFILGTAMTLVKNLIKTVCNSCGPATRNCPSRWRSKSLLGTSAVSFVKVRLVAGNIRTDSPAV